MPAEPKSAEKLDTSEKSTGEVRWITTGELSCAYHAVGGLFPDLNHSNHGLNTLVLSSSLTQQELDTVSKTRIHLHLQAA